jgi:hypothetical protein
VVRQRKTLTAVLRPQQRYPTLIANPTSHVKRQVYFATRTQANAFSVYSPLTVPTAHRASPGYAAARLAAQQTMIAPIRKAA